MAICNQRFNKRIELRAYSAQVIAEHRGGTDSRHRDRSRNRRTPEVPFIAGRSHFNQGFVPKLSPKTQLMQHPCSHYNAFGNLTSPTRLSLRTWQHNMATLMQPFHCDLQPKIPNHSIIATHKHAQSPLKPHQQCGTNHTSKRSYPQPPHTQGTLWN